jgi:hypothetical protein
LSFLGCQNSNEKKIKKIEIASHFIDYNNITVIDSLIKATPYSNDTMFLGFVSGTTNSEYNAHIRKLKKEGYQITYSQSNEFTSFAGSFDLGEGWTFETNIFSENESGDTITGNGKYFLEPKFNKKGNLIQLNILPIEKWDNGLLINNPNWLYSKIKENSSEILDSDFLKALKDNQIIDDGDFVRKKGRLIIYKSSLTITYVDLKFLLEKLASKIRESKSAIEENKKVQF